MWKKKIREFRRKSKIQASGRRRMQRWQRVEERKEKKQKGPDEVPSGRMVGQEKCVCVCVFTWQRQATFTKRQLFH